MPWPQGLGSCRAKDRLPPPLSTTRHGVFRVDIDGPPAEGKPLLITCSWHDGSVDVARERVTRVEPPGRGVSRLCGSWLRLQPTLL